MDAYFASTTIKQNEQFGTEANKVPTGNSEFGMWQPPCSFGQCAYNQNSVESAIAWTTFSSDLLR